MRITPATHHGTPPTQVPGSGRSHLMGTPGTLTRTCRGPAGPTRRRGRRWSMGVRCMPPPASRPPAKDAPQDRQRIVYHAPGLLAECGLGLRLCDTARPAGVGAAAANRCRPNDRGLIDAPLQLRFATPPRTADWIGAFRATVSQRLGEWTASLRDVAQQFAMSPRTLQRRLAKEGTGWRTEIDAARRDLAARLARAGASNEVIATRLGYSDVRALRRALRRWTRQRQSG
jgi:AraC-like DNA-binding protein